LVGSNITNTYWHTTILNHEGVNQGVNERGLLFFLYFLRGKSNEGVASSL